MIKRNLEKKVERPVSVQLPSLTVLSAKNELVQVKIFLYKEFYKNIETEIHTKARTN